ncbi:MAG: DUF4397 domain-containing protein [Betaproteobacteria bacterium]
MSLPRPLVVCVCLIALLVVGCSKSNNSSSSGNGQIRVVNAFFEAPSLNVVVAGTTLASALPFQGLTQYAGVNNGTQTSTVTVTGATTPLVNSNLSINGSANYTYAIFGPLTAPTTIFALDTFNDPGNGFFSLRVMNTAAGIGPIDVYLTPPGADLTVAAPTVGNVPYGGATGFNSVNTGANFEIRITPSGTKQVIFDSVPKTFAEHQGYTILAYSKGSGTLVNVALLNSDGAGTGSIVDNLVAQYKVINASLVGSPLNVFVDGNLQLSNIPYAGVSNYQQTTAGAHAITVQSQATPGATLLTLNLTLSAATDTSIALVGPAGALGGVVLLDDNQPPATGSAGVRFVNTSAAVASVDVFVNFSKQVTGLAMNTASGYVNLTAAALTGTTYEFDFNAAGTTTPVLKLTGVVLLPGHKYTVYLAGPTATLQGIVTQDE